MEDRDHVGFYIKWLSENLTRNMNSQIKRLDITDSQMRTLMYLLRHRDETVIQKDIEHFLGLKHSTVIGLLHRMEKKKLVRVEINANDHRCRSVRPCEKAFKIGGEIEKLAKFMKPKLLKI